jgi:hypothetical protein
VTLSAPSSVGFAVVAGVPSDVRQWITVDLAGYPGSGRRGYVVATEPVGVSWNTLSLAARIRDVILVELRRRQHLPVDEALGRALAAANGFVVGEGGTGATAGPEHALLIGVTALVFEDEAATIAFLPPGQVMLVQDGLIYTVPEVDSWYPSYKPETLQASQAEPLGYATWTAPLIAQTELRPGDTIVVCASETGRAIADELADSGLKTADLARLHGRDPDKVLDQLKDIIIDRDAHAAAVAVIGFPPLPNNARIQTVADVRQRARDQWRHARAIFRQWRPESEPPAPKALGDPENRASPPPSTPRSPGSPARRQTRTAERLMNVFEPSVTGKTLWKQPPEHAQLGIPGRHGVDLFRGQTHYMGDPSWRHNLPRLPVIGSAWIWPVILLIIGGLVLGGLYAREQMFAPDIDVDEALDRIDRGIVAARDEDDPAEAARELQSVQSLIDDARALDVPDDMLDQREHVVTELLDDVTDVVRTSDVQRIGTLPEEFGDAAVQGISTPSGVFFVAGGLYQYRPSPEGGDPELVTILEQGESVGESTVGSLWGVAFDAHGLYVTDGDTVFMLPTESQEWRAVALGRINNQPWEPGPVAAFDGSLYLLQADYRQIYRFPVTTSETVAEPRDWLLTGARDNINRATDIAIDGTIYVLLDDGTIQVMFRGDRRSVIEPPYVEPDNATALVGRGGTGYLYQAVEVEDSGDGRIVAFDVNGQNAVQLMLPIGFTTGDVEVSMPFDGVQDVIVDESTGTIYIINADAIWTTRYSLPALPDTEADATPVSD